MSADGVCFNCGDAGPVHHHHVVPRSLGGIATVPLCPACHGKAHGRERGFRNTSELTRAALGRLKASGVRHHLMLWLAALSGSSSSKQRW